ncbi:MAG: serine kinase [Bacteroidota bacterium]
MTLERIARELELEMCCDGGNMSREVAGGYTGDLLSDVMAHAPAGGVWITIQVHVNIVAVAVLKEVAAIVLANGRRPPDDTLARARAERVTILSSRASAFALAGRLSALGVGGVS